jgi:hypothetical protein
MAITHLQRITAHFDLHRNIYLYWSSPSLA